MRGVKHSVGGPSSLPNSPSSDSFQPKSQEAKRLFKTTGLTDKRVAPAECANGTGGTLAASGSTSASVAAAAAAAPPNASASNAVVTNQAETAANGAPVASGTEATPGPVPTSRRSRSSPSSKPSFIGSFPPGKSKRRKAGAGDTLLNSTKSSGGKSYMRLPLLQRIRLQIGAFMSLLYVELFFVFIVILYGVFVMVQMAIGDDQLAEYQSQINSIDIVLGTFLLGEIVLKLFAYGFDAIRSGWNLFDAIAIVASFVMDIVAATGSTSTLVLRILRLRVLLRIIRVIVVFERIKQRSKSMMAQRGVIQSPVERVLQILNELRFHPALRPKLRDEIEWATDMIKSNRLYDINEDAIAEGVDDDTQNWLRGEILKVNDTNKVLPMDQEDPLNEQTTAPAPPTMSHLTTDLAIVNKVTSNDFLPAMSPEATEKLHQLMQHVADWSFDVFQLDELTNGNALTFVGHFVIHDFLPQSLGVSVEMLVRFLMEIQHGYVATNPYHNSVHAADVMQSTNYFLIQPELTPFLRPLDRVCALVSAAIHDFKHDGFNNGFHIATGSEIATRYNDHSVLENFHVAQAFLVMKDPQVNILGNLSVEDYKYARELMVQMVLATDMAKHFEDVAVFKATILPSDGSAFAIRNVADKKVLLKMVLHTCDVSNPSKDRVLMLKWTYRVVEEFFIQGDKEKQLSLVVSPFMDRDTVVLKKMQVGFADFIVAPLFALWAQIIAGIKTGAYETILGNREFWANQSEEYKTGQIKDTVKELEDQRALHPQAESGHPSQDHQQPPPQQQQHHHHPHHQAQHPTVTPRRISIMNPK